MAYQLEWEPQGVLVKFFGKATNLDFLTAMVKGFGDSRFDSLRYVLAECLNMDECHFNTGTIQELVIQSLGALHTNHRIAVAVVTEDETAMALAHLYQSSGTYRTEIFSTTESARAWIANILMADEAQFR